MKKLCLLDVCETEESLFCEPNDHSKECTNSQDESILCIKNKFTVFHSQMFLHIFNFSLVKYFLAIPKERQLKSNIIKQNINYV